MTRKSLARMEFHISRQARDLYQFDEALFSLSGNVIFANFHAARRFAQKMNARRDLLNFPEKAVRAGQVNAMGLIDEILHIVIQRYREQRNPDVIAQSLDWLYENLGQDQVEAALRQFTELFPPLAVYRREIDLDDYLAGESQRESGEVVPNLQIVLEEMLMLWVANANPALSPYLELFDDEPLEKTSLYSRLIASLYDFFETQPPFGPDYQNLVDMLRSPAIAEPHSLSGQLEYIRTRWGFLLGKYLYRLLSSLDLIKEEQKSAFLGPGPSQVYDFSGLEFEPQRFSLDREWMPNLVLIAKNSYVWLDQLSKKYKRAITRLDQIPDEELDTLARWGFSGLWLIGLWERSQASKTIKKLRGNPDAVASAYSLFSYDIAADLGGEDAYQDLRQRAWQRGIRLASDMVPNHMGIDSRWVIEHPDWFIALNHSPFPSYSFNGPNLSWDSQVGLYLEDHYYNSSDAAVVFKRVDFWSGDEKYIYHGNDGTSMPWNDTAQLNYLLPVVREAVIQTILHVARKFPVIRFDAAMTLAKRHYQRLWFPEPGGGGDIPSRAEYGMSKAQFDQAFPEEFWRQVVDRVAQEVPDTLLLAEAFWLMEGYFVRTLGMHRVYNSAFMNMLRDEKNQEYRLVIKNTLEFDPEILKRYVNFMNNPDERTAVDQFGKGDKYFGVSAMLATLPGLPMFGHGQVEGFTEKYGMEFRRAMWEETPDPYLVERHEREIFPLLRRRYLFAEARDFLLYDFYSPEGHVNEDVFAYSNRAGDERALVVYHNKYASARGWIRLSAAYPVTTGASDERILVQKNLGEGLALQDREDYFTTFRDHINGLEYIRSNRELHQQGLYIELEAYKYQVFLDFRQVQDDSQGRYARLAAHLDGRGVPNIEEAFQELLLQPLHDPYRELVNAGMLNWLIQNRLDAKEFDADNFAKALDESKEKMTAVLEQAAQMAGTSQDAGALANEVIAELEILLCLPALDIEGEQPQQPGGFSASSLGFLFNGPGEPASLRAGDPGVWGTLLAWLFTYKLGKLFGTRDYAEQSRTWIDEWLLGKIIAAVLRDLGLGETAAARNVGLIHILTSQHAWCDNLDATPRVDMPPSDIREAAREEGDAPRIASPAFRMLQSWMEDAQVRHYLMVHRYQSILWFNKEAFEELLWWLLVVAFVHIGAKESRKGTNAGIAAQETQTAFGIKVEEIAEAVEECYGVIEALLEAEEHSAYQVDKLLEAARGRVNEPP